MSETASRAAGHTRDPQPQGSLPARSRGAAPAKAVAPSGRARSASGFVVGSDALEKFARALPATGPDGEGLQATERGAPSPSLQNLLCRVEGPRDLSAGRLGRKLVGSVQQAQAHQPGAPTREGPTNSRDSDGSPRLDPVTSTNRAPAHYVGQLLDSRVTRAAAVRTHVSPPRPLARPKTGVNLVKMFFPHAAKARGFR